MRVALPRAELNLGASGPVMSLSAALIRFKERGPFRPLTQPIHCRPSPGQKYSYDDNTQRISVCSSRRQRPSAVAGLWRRRQRLQRAGVDAGRSTTTGAGSDPMWRLRNRDLFQPRAHADDRCSRSRFDRRQDLQHSRHCKSQPYGDFHAHAASDAQGRATCHGDVIHKPRAQPRRDRHLRMI